MPEIEFTIKEETGEMELLVEGVQGSACSDIAKLVTDLVGAPAREENTGEYYVRPQTLRQVRQKS
ncbi:MAG: DUF2997 domain-containing protein [Pyrinomonadaceae bacterium]